MNEYLGMLMMWPINWAPTNWAMCDGSLIAIADNQTLFSLLGNTYGGDGRTTFALPDLRGRMPVGMGQGPGLNISWQLGERGGEESITLSEANMPLHAHSLNASNTPSSGLTQVPAPGWTLGAADASATGSTPVLMYGNTVPATSVPSAPSSNVGVSAPFNIMPPALCINYIICVKGIYPARA